MCYVCRTRWVCPARSWISVSLYSHWCHLLRQQNFGRRRLTNSRGHWPTSGKKSPSVCVSAMFQINDYSLMEGYRQGNRVSLSVNIFVHQWLNIHIFCHLLKAPSSSFPLFYSALFLHIVPLPRCNSLELGKYRHLDPALFLRLFCFQGSSSQNLRSCDDYDDVA